MSSPASLEIEALHAALAAAEARAAVAEAEAARLTAAASGAEALIAHLKLEIEKLRRALYGRRSERKAHRLAQLELELEELEASAAEDELAAERAAAATVAAFQRRKPSRKPLPAQLPRERVVLPAPAACPCCGSARLCKLGEDITETLEVIRRQWKVIQTVREKFSCRDCERISQPPAPFHATPRGWAGPNLLAMVLFEKYGQHQPLNRQAERYAREGVELSLSTLADQVGASAMALRPLYRLIANPVLAAERLHGDDTTVPARPPKASGRRRMLAKGKTDTGRARLSRHAPVAKAIDYMLTRWQGFAVRRAIVPLERLLLRLTLEDGRICLSNNAAERALRPIALGRKAWLFAGSDRGGDRAALMYTLIVTAKLNDIDPQSWLADVLARIAELPQGRLPELLPWNWKATRPNAEAA